MSARTDFITKLCNANTQPEGYEQAVFIKTVENYVSGLNILKNKIMEWMSEIPVTVSVTDCQAVAENYLYKSPYRAIAIRLTLGQNNVAFEPGPLFFQNREFSVITVKKTVPSRQPRETFAQVYMAKTDSDTPPSVYIDAEQTTELNEESFFKLIADLTL